MRSLAIAATLALLCGSAPEGLAQPNAAKTAVELRCSKTHPCMTPAIWNDIVSFIRLHMVRADDGTLPIEKFVSVLTDENVCGGKQIHHPCAIMIYQPREPDHPLAFRAIDAVPTVDGK